MWDVVRRLVTDGSTVLLTTQYLEEADALADEITVIDRGRVIAHDTPLGLKRTVGGQRLTVRPTDPARLPDVRGILARLSAKPVEASGRDALSVPVTDDAALSAAVARLGRGRHRRHRALAAPPEPGRGVLHDHRPTSRPRRHGRGGRMTTPTLTAPGLRQELPAPTPPIKRSAVRRTLRHSLVLAKRNLVKTWRTPEQLIDVTLRPVIFLILFVYVLAARSAAAPGTTTSSTCCRGCSGRASRWEHRARPEHERRHEKGIFDRFRALPVARSVPLVGAVLAAFVRYLILCAIYLGFGYAMGFRIHTNVASLLAAVVLAVGSPLLLLDLAVGRVEGSLPRKRAGHHVPTDLPARFES